MFVYDWIFKVFFSSRFLVNLRGCFWQWGGALWCSGGARAPPKPLILHPWQWPQLSRRSGDYAHDRLLGWIDPRPHILFRHPGTYMGGGCHPQAISILVVIELRDKDQRIVWDILNPTVSDLTSLGQSLVLPGWVKLKYFAFWGHDRNISFFANNFWTKEDR